MSATAIGERIKAARVRAGFGRGKATAFAEEIGIPNVSLWRYESGIHTPGAEVLAAIARTTGVTIDWLVTGENGGPR